MLKKVYSKIYNSKIYNSKYFPRFFHKKPDGGKDSGVTGYFLIEWKIFFSIGILHFKKGTREAYHNHSFDALTFWLKGLVTEEKINPSNRSEKNRKNYKNSLIPKFTSKSNFHKIIAHKDTYALTFRGPWKDTWNELRKENLVTLTHGRKII
jgi:hypothetical protein